jgi:hypothetical protein
MRNLGEAGDHIQVLDACCKTRMIENFACGTNGKTARHEVSHGGQTRQKARQGGHKTYNRLST